MINEIKETSETNQDHMLITLTLDDGTELVCEVMAVFEANSKEYIALLPLNDKEEEKEMLLFRYTEIDEGEIQIENIDTDEEFEIALDVFNKLIDI